MDELPEKRAVKTMSGWTGTLLYQLVDDESLVGPMIDVLSACPLVAYDTETSGLNPALGARIVGHCLAAETSPGIVTGYYVPVAHVGDHNAEVPQVDPQVAADAVQMILDAPGEMVTHHGKFDLRQARADGIIPTRDLLDVSIAAVIHNENETSFALKRLAAKYLIEDARSEEKDLADWLRADARDLKLRFRSRAKTDPDDLDDLGEKTYLERFGYARAPIALCARYGIHDVLYTLLLWTTKFSRVRDVYGEVFRREHAVSMLLHEMEWHGLLADPQCIRDTHATTAKSVRYWLARCRELTGDEDFAATDTELRELFFETLKLSPPKYTKKSHKPAVDREARLLLSNKYPEHAGLFEAVGKPAEVTKLHSTYAGNYLRYFSEATGSIHPSYNQLEAREIGGVPVTGRLSSANPNVQNVAARAIVLFDGETERTVSVRRYFLVPAGHVRVFIDFSQIELRVLAWLCQDPVLLHAYKNDLDVHQIIADQLHISRKVAKAVNFGNSYGMTEIGLSLRLPGYYEDPEGTRVLAKNVLNDYFVKYRRILEFRRSFADEMRRNGGVFVSPFGRPRRIADIDAPEHWKRGRAERQMMSSIVSGMSADLMKESMIRCAPIAAAFGGKMVQTIHDELIFDLPMTSGWTDVLRALVHAMEDWPRFSQDTSERLGIPIRTNTEVTTTTWEEKKGLVLHDDGSFSLA